MAAWMRAWADYTPDRGIPERNPSQNKVNLPTGIQGDMVMVLVSMIFNTKMEVRV
jgi:hypothetical protein